MDNGLFGMTPEISLLLLGWILGLASSMLTALLLYWLEGKREIDREQRNQRLQDIRAARNWAYEGKKVSLRGYNLRGANLAGKDLSGADLEDANLEGAQWWETNFSGANLRRTSFRNTRIVGTNFTKAYFHANDFEHADIKDTDFSETHLRRVKLGNAKRVQGCTWKSTKIDETTELTPALRREIEQAQEAAPD